MALPRPALDDGPGLPAIDHGSRRPAGVTGPGTMGRVAGAPRQIARRLPWPARRLILVAIGRPGDQPRVSVDRSGFNRSYTGPRPELVDRVPPDRRAVLDLGCATGEVGKALKERSEGVRVVGIELDPTMAAAARTRIDRVIVADLEDLEEVLLELADERFDAVIAGDILEHLVDPWKTLRALHAVLEPGAVIVASLPNIGFWDTWWNVIVRGQWPYRPRGIHDSTHLRFFAARNIGPLFEQANFVVDRIDRQYRLIERPHRWNEWARWVAIPGLRRFLTFQFLVTARQAGAAPDEDARDEAVRREQLPPPRRSAATDDAHRG